MSVAIIVLLKYSKYFLNYNTFGNSLSIEQMVVFYEHIKFG